MTSNQASRLAAYRDRLPASILFLLFTCSILTVLLLGREQGAANNSEIVGTLCFIFLVSLAVYVTLDLNMPEGGWVRVSQEPIERLLSSMSNEAWAPSALAVIVYRIIAGSLRQFLCPYAAEHSEKSRSNAFFRRALVGQSDALDRWHAAEVGAPTIRTVAVEQ